MNNDLKRRIENIKERVSVEALIILAGGYVRSSWGDWQKTICPFHQDTVPSAATNLMAGVFVCHACGVKGDVITIARLHLEQTKGGSTFSEALEWLEDFG